MMGGRTLQRASGRGYEDLNGFGIFGSRECFCFRLSPTNDRDGHEILVNLSIQLENLPNFCRRLLFRCKSGVSLLPQKFSVAKEEIRLTNFHSYNTAPLIETQRKISIRLNPVLETGVHSCLASRTNRHRLFKFSITALRHHGNFGCKIIQMILFSLQIGLWDEKREVTVFDAQFFDLAVEPALNEFPSLVCPRTVDVASLHGVIFHHFRFGNNLLIPQRDIFRFFSFNTSSLIGTLFLLLLLALFFLFLLLFRFLVLVFTFSFFGLSL
mmetsp:Transcript_15774/g.43639  ORF Transcript_15774/g.43639 Transcript_15774/m.43639 type:complete len:269 (-) Transcript_15774:488-1294(-)